LKEKKKGKGQEKGRRIGEKAKGKRTSGGGF